jgi:hypothetical protein
MTSQYLASEQNCREHSASSFGVRLKVSYPPTCYRRKPQQPQHERRGHAYQKQYLEAHGIRRLRIAQSEVPAVAFQVAEGRSAKPGRGSSAGWRRSAAGSAMPRIPSQLSAVRASAERFTLLPVFSLESCARNRGCGQASPRTRILAYVIT